MSHDKRFVVAVTLKVAHWYDAQSVALDHVVFDTGGVILGNWVHKGCKARNHPAYRT